ncbi:cyclic nucleotide-binding domain-containing protein [Cohnella sp. CFH 77786]|uniref:cyclic nucleotide-binding domain-containing protein n=1 Tax=Cohnella sp. CFH 77786 TaxID=2662265 RepID=UPI001C60C1A4|nr:cyclic nucleotide-binding domain-containing protein [Cohnella sp. CFH 77786]MBW5445774.1 cyclic nucleotide-binding domain-containing protein [Cohnella sp. CFH 77786]
MKITRMKMFHGLSNIELAKLLGKLDKLQLASGDTLFEQGDHGESMYLNEKGKIEFYSQKNDARQPLAFLMEGDSLGEMALITGEARSSTAVAAEHSDLVAVEDHDIFHRDLRIGRIY